MGRGADETEITNLSPLLTSGRINVNAKIKEEEEGLKEDSVITENGYQGTEEELEEEIAQREREERERAKKEREARERKAALVKEIKKEEVRQRLLREGISDFSENSRASRALGSDLYLESDYLIEVEEIKDQFLKSKGENYLWRFYRKSAFGGKHLLEKGTALDSESAQENATRARDLEITKKLTDLKKEVAEELEKKKSRSDISDLDIPHSIDSNDIEHIRRSSLPGNYDVVTYVIKKIIYNKKGFPRRTFLNANPLYRKRRVFLIFHEGKCLPIADGRDTGYIDSFPESGDHLGLGRFFPGLIHRQALDQAQDLIREYILEQQS